MFLVNLHALVPGTAWQGVAAAQEGDTAAAHYGADHYSQE